MNSTDNNQGKGVIFDPVRQKYISAQPEEIVRQYFVDLLHKKYGYPYLRMSNEYSIRVGKLPKRCDTVVLDNKLNPLMIIEYKATHVKLSQEIIEQAFRYNAALGVPYIIITNGKQMAIYKVGYKGSPTITLPDIPYYSDLIKHP